MAEVAIVMGSKSDYDVVVKAKNMLSSLGIDSDMRILSAHRTPKEAMDFASGAKDKGYKIIIAAAGKAAHLAGVIAGNTLLPVIGLPVKSSTMDGLDSLLSTVQMPTGVPVATVAINGADNAALLAAQILAVTDVVLYEKLLKHREEMRKAILKDDELIN